MMGGDSQADLVLAYMRDHGGITRLEAFEELGVGNLTARISDLRARGIKVRCDWQKRTRKDGKKVRWGRFTLGDK